jgi:hypothetical protein
MLPGDKHFLHLPGRYPAVGRFDRAPVERVRSDFRENPFARRIGREVTFKNYFIIDLPRDEREDQTLAGPIQVDFHPSILGS